ncbi:MAG: RNA methyltransferase [Candidatus Magasanikbacteria bacterium CG11_big_fil_rev_8_21_14_0_20_43_7]|uniref:RNA methyltransferase n=1 Tax=Candidatus Magasanikbacteria bacterium CG11_big_fil_rev_8_21_14_0_20_43_7 TaxID=1974654 RepID=A0A2H0N2Y4_9BACT|nr:MAG: RNA methyltransferase [Candidatus Magasanikbacteria bacterium CG11_big_fil_rev_8_21_14_0_20_43_7]
MYKKDIVLILPNIRSCHNVGAMFRTADAFGVDKIFLVGYTPTPPKPQIDKVSLGAEQWIPWEQRKDLKRLIASLKKRGVAVIGLEQSETSIRIGALKLDTSGAVALIVGNEVDGIADDILEMCDRVVHIPMYGRKESLNVSVAAGIAMYALRHG